MTADGSRYSLPYHFDPGAQGSCGRPDHIVSYTRALGLFATEYEPKARRSNTAQSAEYAARAFYWSTASHCDTSANIIGVGRI